jgi:hypothetical protein
MQVTMAPPLTNVKEGCLLKKMFQENNRQINLLQYSPAELSGADG